MNLKTHIAHFLIALLGLYHFLYIDISYAAINPSIRNVHKRQRNKCIYFQLSEALQKEIAKAPQTGISRPKPLCFIFDNTSVTEAPILNLNYSYIEIPAWATKINLVFPTSQGIKEFFIEADDLEEIMAFSPPITHTISLVKIDNYPLFICIDNITSIFERLDDGKNSIVQQAQDIENHEELTDTLQPIQQKMSTAEAAVSGDDCWLQYCIAEDTPSFPENIDGHTSDY